MQALQCFKYEYCPAGEVVTDDIVAEISSLTQLQTLHLRLSSETDPSKVMVQISSNTMTSILSMRLTELYISHVETSSNRWETIVPVNEYIKSLTFDTVRPKPSTRIQSRIPNANIIIF